MSDEQKQEPLVEAEIVEEPTSAPAETAAPEMTKPVTDSEPLADSEPAEPSSAGVKSVEPVEPVKAVKAVEPPFKAKLVGLHELKAGQTVRIHERIVDISPKGEARERVQVFEGIILGLSGAGIGRTMTARKVSDGVSVEKIYPINSPVIAKIELVKTAKVRRAKLRFLLNLKDRFKRKMKETYVK